MTEKIMKKRKKRQFILFAAFIAAFSFFSYGRGIGVNADGFGADFETSAAGNAVCVQAKAACVIELSSRRLVFEKDGERKLPMASTTKIATALTVLDELTENGDESRLDEKFFVPAACCDIEGSSVYLKENDETSARELLYGLMLRSGNDCAAALAWHVSGGVKKFAEKMNETAKRAGALNTHFKNPHGLPEKGHYTTARDLSMLTALALGNETFAKIVSTRMYEPKHWANKNKMLAEYEGAIGVKTGYTKQAGRCLVSAAKRNEMTLICTVLNCPDTYGESKKLLNDAFSAYEFLLLQAAESPVSLDTRGGKVFAKTEKDLRYPLLSAEKQHIKKTTIAFDTPLKDKNGREICGQLRIYLLNSLLFSENLYKIE